jgi:hypothetical protein
MVTAAFSAVFILATSVGTVHCGHDRVRDECTVCAEVTPEVLEQVSRLQTCDGWIARRKAAKALRKYDWKCQPEAAEALADALLHDDCGLVRQAAAESLAKMRPCLPTVHMALAKAVRCEKNPLTRCTAKRALKAIGKSCTEECALCGADGVVVSDDPLLMSPGTSSVPLEDSTVEPLPPAILDTPSVPPPSLDRPGMRPPLPSPAPVPGTIIEPAPAEEAPPLEAPSLPSPRRPTGRGVSDSLRSSPATSLRGGPARVQFRARPVFLSLPNRPDLAGSLPGDRP